MAVRHVVLRLCRIKNVLFNFCPKLSSLVCSVVVYRMKLFVCSHRVFCVFTLMYSDSNLCSCPVFCFAFECSSSYLFNSPMFQKYKIGTQHFGN